MSFDPNICGVCGKAFTRSDTVVPEFGANSGRHMGGMNVHVECAGHTVADAGPGAAVAALVQGPQPSPPTSSTGVSLLLPPHLLAEIDKRAAPTTSGKGRSVVVGRILARHFKMIDEALPALVKRFDEHAAAAIAGVWFTCPCQDMESLKGAFLSPFAIGVCKSHLVHPETLQSHLNQMDAGEEACLLDCLERLALLPRPQYRDLLKGGGGNA